MQYPHLTPLLHACTCTPLTPLLHACTCTPLILFGLFFFILGTQCLNIFLILFSILYKFIYKLPLEMQMVYIFINTCQNKDRMASKLPSKQAVLLFASSVRVSTHAIVYSCTEPVPPCCCQAAQISYAKCEFENTRQQHSTAMPFYFCQM